MLAAFRPAPYPVISVHAPQQGVMLKRRCAAFARKRRSTSECCERTHLPVLLLAWHLSALPATHRSGRQRHCTHNTCNTKILPAQEFSTKILKESSRSTVGRAPGGVVYRHSRLRTKRPATPKRGRWPFESFSEKLSEHSLYLFFCGIQEPPGLLPSPGPPSPSSSSSHSLGISANWSKPSVVEPVVKL